MLKTLQFLLALACLAAASSTSVAQERVRVGILPFDVASVDGGTNAAATALAKLVRAELITNKRVQPVLLETPPGAKLPLSDKQLAALAEANDVQVIVSGTILEARTTRGNQRASTGGLGGRIGASVGGSVSRTRADVKMQVELAGRNGEVTETFPVDGSNTDVGVGADIWTALGNFDSGDTGWEKSPMGKALREAAQQLAAEVVKRKSR